MPFEGGAVHNDEENTIDDKVWMFDQTKKSWKTFKKSLMKPRVDSAAIVVEYAMFKQFCI